MKTLFSLSTLMLITATLLSIFSCEKAQKTDQTYQEVEAYLKSGAWYLSKCVDSGENEVSHFTGYTFNFNDDGSVNATNGNYVNNGTWKLTPPRANRPVVLTLVFNTGTYFQDLTNDWEFTQYNSMQLALQEVQDSNVHLDYLTFEKK